MSIYSTLKKLLYQVKTHFFTSLFFFPAEHLFRFYAGNYYHASDLTLELGVDGGAPDYSGISADSALDDFRDFFGTLGRFKIAKVTVER